MIGLLRSYAERSRRAAQDFALSLVGPVLFVGGGFARNVHLTGSWKGGNGKPMHNAVLGVVKTALRSVDDLFFGLESAHWTRFLQAVVVAIVLFTVLPAARRSARGVLRDKMVLLRDTGTVVLVSLLSFYFVGMTYLGVVSVISFGARLFLPMLPLLLLLFGRLLADETPFQARGAVLAAVGGLAYLAGNAASYTNGGLAPHEVTGRALASRTNDGTTVHDWLLSHARADEPILASNGQGTAYALGRPVVSLTDSEYGERPWDEERVEATMDHFHIRYLLLYPNLERRQSAVLEESSFLSALVQAKPTPGFTRVAASDAAYVFERTASGGP
jgi:hypothetical protein